MEWISIKDKLPEILDEVIFWHPNNNKVLVGRVMPSEIMVNGFGMPCSHWMSLPLPPTDISILMAENM